MAGQGSKIARLTRMGLVCVLCFESFACGARPGRDLSMQGAFGKFDERRAATRAKQAEMSLEQAYEYTADVMAENMIYEETNEGISAFIEKRTPEWTE